MMGRVFRQGLATLMLMSGSEAIAGGGLDLGAWLEPERQRLDLPALGAVVVTRDRHLALGVAGRRSIAAEVPVGRADAWHLGSITKSMTAVVAARLVDRGIVAFETSVGDVLGAKFPHMDARYRSVTLEQLLGHLGGLPGDLTALQVWQEIDIVVDEPAVQRHALLEEILRVPPVRQPGSGHHYSNAGYVLAATLLEVRSGRSWETLIEEELFSPLGLSSAGLGAPGQAGSEPDQPLGHRTGNGLEPMAPGPFADHPPALAPAGTVHMNLEDLGTYLQSHLGAGLPAGAILPEGLLWRLHEPLAEQHFALGWWVERFAESERRRLVHEGSNTFWFAIVWLLPQEDLALAVVTNRVPEDLDAPARLAHDLLAAIEDGALRQQAAEAMASE